jgi:hypothetical protein
MTTLARFDIGLEATIRTRLFVELGAALRDMRVLAIDGRLRPWREAISYADKKPAAELTECIPGVRRVINQIRVVPS